jgi:hypothetical protein
MGSSLRRPSPRWSHIPHSARGPVRQPTICSGGSCALLRAVWARSSMLLVGVLVAGLLIALPPVAAHAAPLNDCVSSDNGDPILKSFRRTPAAVDVTARAKRVFFHLKVADLGGPGPASGVRRVWVGFGEAPSLDVNFVPIAKLRRNGAGAWVGSVVVPRWRRPGRVRLGVLLGDKAENYRFVDPADLAAAGFPNRVLVRSTPDTTAPRLTSLGFTPRRVNTRRSPRTLTVTAKARDSQSRVRSITVNGQMRSQNLTRDPDGSIRLTKVAGTANKFKGTTRVPRWVGTGTWKVYLVRVEDHIGNATSYGYHRLGRLGFDRKLRVVSRFDTQRPTLKKFSLNPTAVDVRAANKQVTVTARGVDAQSGVRTVEALLWDRFSGRGGLLHRVAGTRRDGVWRGVFTVHRCTAQAGALRATVQVSDRSGKTTTYRSASLADNGWPNQVMVTAVDHTAPSAFVEPSAPPAGPIKVTFSENVNGITSSSAVVRRMFGFFTDGPVIPGTWACTRGTGAVTNCQTGRVRTARFTPTDPLVASSRYSVTFNPEFSLSVTDLAGNPFNGEELSGQVAP